MTDSDLKNKAAGNSIAGSDIADDAPVMIWSAGVDGRCIWFNKAWLNFTGGNLEAERGDGWIAGIHADDLKKRLDVYRAALASREAFSVEYRLLRADGNYRWLLDHGVPRQDADGNFSGFIGTCIDVTDRRAAEDLRKEADRGKNEFIATLAHELRNPLAPIRTGLEILRGGILNGVQQKVVGIMERQIEQIVHLVDDLLEISHITQGKVELKHERIDLAKLLRDLGETFQQEAQGRLHRIEITPLSQPVWVEGDPLKLDQIFKNLLINAAKHSPSGGAISIGLAVQSEAVTVTVGDNATAAADDLQKQVYQTFSENAPVAWTAAGSLGIGLSVVKNLVHLQGGSARAASGRAGKGSEFSVTLQLSKAAPEPETTTGRRILLVDDNVDAAVMLEAALTAKGFIVRLAFDGNSAVSESATFHPEICVCDIGLPDIDGHEVARRLKSATPELLMIAVSGWGQRPQAGVAVETSFAHHLIKPIRLDELLPLIGD